MADRRGETTSEVAEHLPLPPRILAMLLIVGQDSGGRHGYGIMQDLREGRTGERWTVGPATLYRTLKQLERDGLICGSERGGESEGPPRKYYTLTILGQRVMTADAARMMRLVEAARRVRIGRAAHGPDPITP